MDNLKATADYWRKVKSGELPAPSPNDMDFTIWTAEAAIRRIAELEAKTAMSMGVGSGDGSLFQHGDCDSIKAAQTIVIESESLRAKLATPDGYCIMPMTLTAANGAKGALSGEFKVSRTVRCHECGGEGCDDCGDAGEIEEEITVPWGTIKDIYRAAVDACRTGRLAEAPEGGNAKK